MAYEKQLVHAIVSSGASVTASWASARKQKKRPG